MVSTTELGKITSDAALANRPTQVSELTMVTGVMANVTAKASCLMRIRTYTQETGAAVRRTAKEPTLSLRPTRSMLDVS